MGLGLLLLLFSIQRSSRFCWISPWHCLLCFLWTPKTSLDCLLTKVELEKRRLVDSGFSEHLLSSPWGILSLSSTVCGSSMASSCYPGRCISDNRMTFCVKSTSAPKGLKACHAPRFCCILRPFFREKCPSGILLEYIKININCYHIFIYIFVCFMSFHLLLCTYDLLQSSITLYWCFIKNLN